MPAQFHTAEALQNAVRNHQTGKLDVAENLYREILRFSPDHADTLNLLGVLLHQQGKTDEGIASLRQAISGNPSSAHYYNNLGNIHKDRGDMEEALAAYRRAIALRPRYPEAYHNMAVAQRTAGDVTAALEILQTVVSQHPDFGTAWYTLGTILHRDLGKIEEALVCYRRTLSIQPHNAEAHWNLANTLLLLGKFKEGWAEYEWRWRWQGFTTKQRRFPQPRWDGSPLQGRRLLIHHEQGIGDTLQLIRYVDQIRQAGGKPLLLCRPSLSRLLQSIEGLEGVYEKEELLPDFDCHLPIMSLPGLFETEKATIPGMAPYLHALEGGVDLPREEDGTTLKVGIVWAGSPTHGNDGNRSCTLDHFRHLLEIPGTTFYSLQKGPKTSECIEHEEVVDLAPLLYDFADTADFIRKMDLVISVDTAVAHLAGAMAKPVWVILPFVPDWRWMLHREDSPWYPTMRLFRQKAPGAWQDLFERVLAALRDKLETPHAEL